MNILARCLQILEITFAHQTVHFSCLFSSLCDLELLYPVGHNPSLSWFILLVRLSPISPELLQPAPVSFGHVLIFPRARPDFWDRMLWAHHVLCLSKPWNQSFLRGSLILFLENYIKVKIWALGVPLAAAGSPLTGPLRQNMPHWRAQIHTTAYRATYVSTVYLFYYPHKYPTSLQL